MFRNHYITIAAWIIVYISLWLSRDNLVSSKFSKNNCHTGFVSRIIETMIFPFQWYKNRPTYVSKQMMADVRKVFSRYCKKVDGYYVSPGVFLLSNTRLITISAAENTAVDFCLPEKNR